MRAVTADSLREEMKRIQSRLNKYRNDALILWHIWRMSIDTEGDAKKVDRARSL